MERALFSGVTGLASQQLMLDTTANNLANISTSGFKGSRVSFSTALMQTQSAGSAPNAALGGVNPRQIGSGNQSSSIDVDMRQGSLNSTGRNLDLAIQGNGFFRLAAPDGSSAYTRVGNFGTDAKDNMIDMGSGMFVQGRLLDTSGVPTGDRTTVNLSAKKSIDAKVTSSVTLQGNLNSATAALKGSSLTSILPLTVASTGAAATATTNLKDLTIFTGPTADPGATAAPPTATSQNLRVFGTKPDGTPYAASFTIRPWGDPIAVPALAPTTVQDLINGINAGLTQGSNLIGTASLDNGSLKITGSGTASQKDFSLFLGVVDPLATPVSPDPIGAPFSADFFGGTTTIAGGATNVSGVASATAVAPMEAAPGLINPSFTLTSAGPVTIAVKITHNGTTTQVGSITLAAGAAGAHPLSATGNSLPYVQPGDTVIYEKSDPNQTVDFTTGIYPTTGGNSNNNILRDKFGGSAASPSDGLPDLFQEGSGVDVNEYVYRKTTNTHLDLYKLRFVPEKVTTSIQVYDSVGGAHTVQASFFRTGTSSTAAATGTARYNNWDMMIDVPPSEGRMTDGLVTGIQFDQTGKYIGNNKLGVTAMGNPLSDPASYVGNPSDNTIKVAWKTTGDSTISLNFGDAGTSNGLTGFGAPSTASAVDQDGYASGSLDTLSVDGAGTVTGLYTNGKSLGLYQLEIDVFRNPAGLSAAGKNLWQSSANSGDPLARTAGTGGAGTITAGALEGSNIDIATEFTRLITAQRGFQVNSRVIQTTDSILQELAGLIRG